MGGVKETGLRISNFINAKQHVLNVFGIEEDFFVKPLLDKNWEVEISPDFCVLRHGASEETMQSSVIVRKDNKPIIVKKNNYTMVVALDCVKVCFIFTNSNYIGSMPKIFG